MKDIRRGRHLRWRCATMKGKDRLTLWCEHLVLNTLKLPGYPRESLLICTDLTLALPPLDNAPELLADLVELYREGLCRPLHFFPQSSWLYLKEGMAKADGALERNRLLAVSGGIVRPVPVTLFCRCQMHWTMNSPPWQHGSSAR